MGEGERKKEGTLWGLMHTGGRDGTRAAALGTGENGKRNVLCWKEDENEDEFTYINICSGITTAAAAAAAASDMEWNE